VRLESIQVGKPRHIDPPPPGDPSSRLFRSENGWRSGYGKARVEGKVRVGKINLDGDGQCDKRHHGGPDMAILAYSADHYPRWHRELEFPALPYGAFAENLTVQGVDESSVCLGDIWEVGAAGEITNVQLQISQPRKPCVNISKFWHRIDLLERVIDSCRIGWYMRVLREGEIEAGAEIRLLARPHPDWSVERAMQVRLEKSRNPAAAAALAGLPELGDDWRARLSE